MSNQNLITTLNRIANALERLANACGESGSEMQKATSLLPENNNGVSSVNVIVPIDDIEDKDEQEDVIVDFLANKKITITRIPPEVAYDATINSIAKFLGEHYEAFKEILVRIKQNMNSGRRFEVSLKNYTQKEISDACQLCKRLFDIAFLEQYIYKSAPQCIITAKTTTLPKAQNFFAGVWLERYVLQAVQAIIEKLLQEGNGDINFTYFINPQIALPNGDAFELDLIFQVNNVFYWVEAKSGDYAQHIAKYQRMSKLMGLDSDHSVLVLPEISHDQATALTALYSMNVYNLENLHAEIETTIRRDLVS